MKINTVKLIAVIFLIAILGALVSIAGSARQAEDPGVLLRAAIEKEEVDGDLQGAIDLYKQIVAKHSDNRPIAAKALVRLGGCYEKLGKEQAGLAQKAFETVVKDYPDQTEAVNLAKEKLAAVLRARAMIEKGGGEYTVTKIHSDEREGWLSPDGTRLVLLQYDKGYTLWLRDLASGKEVCLLPAPELITDCWWSPDGRLIAYFTGAGHIRVFPAAGGPPKTIIEADPEINKAGRYAWPMGWTSDSKKLMFQVSTQRSHEGLYAVPASGGEWEEIYKFPDPQGAKDRNESFVLSPDGRLLALQSTRGGNQDIYVMPAGGGEPVRITDDPAADKGPVWSYDGRWLAFDSARTGSSETWVIRITPEGKPGGQPVQATRGGGAGTWTLNGKIAFSTSTDQTHIYIANTDGSQENRLTKLNNVNVLPRWSPDGRTIAFVADYGTQPRRMAVWTVPSTGGDGKFLALGWNPAWSPDGKEIAFGQLRRVGSPVKATISIIPADGGKAREIMNYDGEVNFLDWSPDGRHIVFSYSRVKDGERPIPDSREIEQDIYLISVTGGEPKRLTPMDGKDLEFMSPRWSPDGKTIAFLWINRARVFETGELGEPARIYTMDAGGGNLKLVTDEHPLYWFCWSRDGRHIIFDKPEEGFGIFRVPAAGGKAEPMNLTGGAPDLSPDGKKIAFYRKAKSRTEFWLAENFLPADTAKKYK